MVDHSVPLLHMLAFKLLLALQEKVEQGLFLMVESLLDAVLANGDSEGAHVDGWGGLADDAGKGGEG